jgi:hypothetical protein
MDLAQQVKTSLVTSNEQQEAFHHRTVSSRFDKYQQKRRTSSRLSHVSHDSNDIHNGNRLLNRRQTQEFPRLQTAKSRIMTDKVDTELTTNTNEHQDPGIWVHLLSLLVTSCSFHLFL